MPATWISKYGYGSPQGQTSTKPVSSGQPTWVAKYGTIPQGSTAPISPAIKNAQKNQNTPASPSIGVSSVSPNFGSTVVNNFPQPKPQSFMDKIKYATAEVGKKLKYKVDVAADKFTKGVKNLPEATFADDENMWTPVGFAKTVAQSVINTAPQAFKGAASLGENLGAGTSTPQQVAADVAAAAQLPLLILSGGGSGLIKAGLQTGAKGVAKQIGKEAITGAGFGTLTGFQTGKNIDNVKDYLKNMLVNIGIGGAAGGALKGATMVVAPLAKGLSNKLGAVFINNGGKTPVVKEIRLDPKVAQSTVISNNLDNTPIGKAVVKESLVATEQGGHVSITPIEKGKYELPGGGKANVTTSTIYDPATFDKTAQQSAKILPDGTQKETFKTQVTPQAKATVNENAKVQTGQVPQSKVQVPQAEGQVKTSKLGLRVEQTAIEKKLTSDLGELPQYKTMNMKEQANKAATLINSDPEKAFRVAMGQELPPAGLTKESVFKAVEGSITTPEDAVRLANSPLVSEASELGQRIKSLDVKTAESPVEAIRQVINARSRALEGKSGSIEKAITKTTEEIKKRVKTPDRYDWNNFIESIKC